MTTSRNLERIAALLYKAENTDNEHEAAALMSKAQQLATMFDIDVQKARAVADKKHAPTQLEQRTMVIGVPGTRGLNTLVSLASGIAGANDVRMDIAHNSTRVYLFGFSDNIDVVERLYASLSIQMASAAERFRREGSWKDDTMFIEGRYRWIDERTGKQSDRWDYHSVQEWVPGGEKPMTWRRAKLDFQASYARRIATRLSVARSEAMAQARAAEETIAEQAAPETVAAPSAALVLADKEVEVRNFHKENSNARGSYKGWRNTSSRVASAAGRRAANNARLSPQHEIGGSRRGLAS